MTPRKGESRESFLARDREKARAYYAAHRERMLSPNRAYSQAFYAANREKIRARHRVRNSRLVGLGGNRVHIDSLPPELRPVAELIKETRREIIKRGGRAGAY